MCQQIIGLVKVTNADADCNNDSSKQDRYNNLPVPNNEYFEVIWVPLRVMIKNLLKRNCRGLFVKMNVQSVLILVVA